MAELRIVTKDDNAELLKRLDYLINSHHTELRESGARLVLVWQSGGMENKGKTALAKCQKATKLLKTLTNYDYAISLNEDYWDELSHQQQEALLDHELCHVRAWKDEKGKWKLSLRPHDLEEFRDVVERHGIWLDDIRLFIKAADRSRANRRIA